ncbi:MAG: hypothetical protein JOZ31_07585 [Verrucomicrobia bacterium]|nr:hypothetical protein [Verrucomicrobiota bacterium]
MANEITNYYEKLEIGALTYLLVLLNAEIDKGDKWRSITFEDVYSRLEIGDLIPFLDERLHLELAFTLGPEKEQGKLLLAGLRHISEYTRDRESQKLGLEKSGVCLLVAWVLSLIQGGLWNFTDRWLTDHRNLYVHGTPIHYDPSNRTSEER